MTAAVEMYLAGEEERDVESVGFEGRVYTERRFEMLGEFGGQRFDVELETAQGRDTATFPGQRTERRIRRWRRVFAQLAGGRCRGDVVY